MVGRTEERNTFIDRAVFFAGNAAAEVEESGEGTAPVAPENTPVDEPPGTLAPAADPDRSAAYLHRLNSETTPANLLAFNLNQQLDQGFGLPDPSATAPVDPAELEASRDEASRAELIYRTARTGPSLANVDDARVNLQTHLETDYIPLLEQQQSYLDGQVEGSVGPTNDRAEHQAITQELDDARALLADVQSDAAAAEEPDFVASPDEEHAAAFGENIEEMYADDIAEIQELTVEEFKELETPPRLRELREQYGESTSGINLLLNGNYDNHPFRQGLDIDLDAAEAAANEFNGEDNHVVIQSVFDPVVSDKPLTIDEYSVVVDLPEGMDPTEFLHSMAADMDGALGDDFREAGDFRNQGESPEVGQIIEIDVNDVPQIPIPFVGDESPVNAPVIITSIGDDHFAVQTVELNGEEHPLHGTREWGFEPLEDGTYRFYTRGISVEDTFGAEQFARGGEWGMWNRWVDGVENTVVENGGSVVEGTRINSQSTGPTGADLFGALPPDQQADIQAAQIAGLEREIEWLNAEFPPIADPAIVDPNLHRVLELQREIEAWQNVSIG